MLRVILVIMLLVLIAVPSSAGDPAPFTARAGLGLATDAAHTWAPDARLIYIENDEDVAEDGTALRWGYLFYSASKQLGRGYSIRDGKILEAADLGFDFEAPPLDEDWIDSGQALAAAEKKAGAEYRREYGGRLATMLLIRGAFHDRKPNATTWAFVYTSDNEPSLFVVVEASRGNVVKTWRG